MENRIQITENISSRLYHVEQTLQSVSDWCLPVCVCGELRCAVWNWSTRWRRTRSSRQRCRLSPQSTTNSSSLSSRDPRGRAHSARTSSTMPFLVSPQAIKLAKERCGVPGKTPSQARRERECRRCVGCVELSLSLEKPAQRSKMCN